MDEFENTDQSTEESFAVEDSSTETEAPKVSPAWEDMLSKLPEEFHPVLTPTLSDWDKNFQKVQQDYAPYKDFVDNNIPVETIQQSLQIRDLLENNPQGVYEFLQNQYKFGQPEVEKTGPSVEEDTYDYEDSQDISKHPKFMEMSQQIQGFTQMFEDQQKRETEQKVQQSIENDFNDIATKYSGGKLDEQTKIDIARLAMGAGDNDLQKAANDYFTRFRAPARASDSAPPVIRGNSRVPQGVTLADIAKMGSEDRVNAMAAMMEANAKSNN